MVKKIVLSLIGALVFAGCVMAQTKQIRGRVVDENSEAVIGASVVITGTTVGVTTDMNGEFLNRDRVNLIFIQIRSADCICNSIVPISYLFNLLTLRI
ncbi:MAG: carboxypeptidase-like regulatory domain-containing protein, partial [Alistipes sp.]|nr:carboxypeptidase-like regulatory domain-containing protein [Alistipes sp.]